MYLYMIICIIGSGGREHAICKTISLSSKVSKIYCMPGNAGTQQLAQNIELDINNFEKVLKVNLTSVFLCSKAAAKIMEKLNGGSIINISSIFSRSPICGRS